MESPVASSSRLGAPHLFPSSLNDRDSRRREEDLVYLFEAEEERITNLLSRKLEKLKEEKIELENLLEAENEAHVNRLSRELTALRAAQAQPQPASQTTDDDRPRSTTAAGKRPATNGSINATANTPSLPSQNLMLEAMRRENQELRNRL
ncbi:hypothetical protein FRC00_004058 [Tulasnella sp. 408]|nr:hypothetical protein FRC00_004058 [Tulasnella sp. 408]